MIKASAELLAWFRERGLDPTRYTITIECADKEARVRLQYALWDFFKANKREPFVLDPLPSQITKFRCWGWPWTLTQKEGGDQPIPAPSSPTPQDS